ncbi:flavin-containing monooxygenase [Nannocystaceae bacterium ST9]
MSASQHVHIAILGAGFSGVGAAIRLLQSGVRDFVVFERADEVGGVWRDNEYPGCACDVEAPLYSFSFAPNPRWSRLFAPQPEIWAYLRRCVDEHGVRPHLRLGHAIESVRWDEDRKRWTIASSRGSFTADVVIAGTGALSEPIIPALPGRERFAGKAFHSAHWDHEHALEGRRVAVVGTGASAIQIVPNIQPKLGKLLLFQRTPAWVVPRFDREFGPRVQQLFETLPISQKLLRAGLYVRHESLLVGFRNPAIMQLIERRVLRYLAHVVHDEPLRQRLTPDFRLGCKRVLVSSDYLPALTRPNVEVVASAVRELVPEGLIDEQGRTHEVDTIVFATGFRVTDQPFSAHVHGRDGQTLAEVWRGSPQAYLGTMISGFPNFFLMTGPNTGLGHSSMLLMIEAQLELVLGALRELDERGTRTIEPKPEVQRRFVDEIQRGGAGTVWTAGGCQSWYLDATGRNSTLWPWSTWAYMRRAKFEREAYLLSR